MSKFHFYRFENYKEGKMAVLDAIDVPCPYPVNVYIDNYEDAVKTPECDVVIDVHGVCEDLKIFESEDETEIDGMAAISLIPMGTFPLDPGEGASPHVLFSGKIVYVEKNPDPQGEINYFLRIETYGMIISTYIHSDFEIWEANFASGVAWLYGDMISERGERREESKTG